MDKQTISINELLEKIEKEKKLRISISKLAHELKNPLSVCNGYLNMIDFKDNKKNNKYLSIIKDEIERSINILTFILNMVFVILITNNGLIKWVQQSKFSAVFSFISLFSKYSLINIALLGAPHIIEDMKIVVILSSKLNNILNIFFIKLGIINLILHFTNRLPNNIEGNKLGNIFIINIILVNLISLTITLELYSIKTSTSNKK